MSDEQRAPDSEEQKKMANAGDDVQAHGKLIHPKDSEPTEDEREDVEAHGKLIHPKDSAPSDDDDNDVEAHFKAGNRL